MIVEEIMHTEVITLYEDDKIEKACKLILTHQISHLPVVTKDNHIIGIVSDRDIRDASPSVFHSNDHLEDMQKPISSIMTKNVITGHPLDFVEEIAATFYEHHIGCLPIVTGKEKKLVGIVTETDLLHTLVQLTGANQPTSRIEVRVENKAGVLAEVATVFKRCKVNINSVFVSPNLTEEHKILVFRIKTINPMEVLKELKKEGYEVLWPNLPGVSS